jgi:tRNA(fMet)-specific endonuclease VapC
MLDTNIISDLIHDPVGVVARHIGQVGDEGLVVSIVTACELRFGAMKRGSRRLTERIEAVLRGLPVMPLECPADEAYGSLRATLEAKGTPIGPNDLLIASHALALNVPLVTDNVDEFARVPGLVIENWLARK